MFSWATHAAVMPLKSRSLPTSISVQSDSQSLGPFNDAPRTPYSFFIFSKSRPCDQRLRGGVFRRGDPLGREHGVEAGGDHVPRLRLAGGKEDLDETRLVHVARHACTWHRRRRQAPRVAQAPVARRTTTRPTEGGPPARPSFHLFSTSSPLVTGPRESRAAARCLHPAAESTAARSSASRAASRGRWARRARGASWIPWPSPGGSLWM